MGNWLSHQQLAGRQLFDLKCPEFLHLQPLLVSQECPSCMHGLAQAAFQTSSRRIVTTEPELVAQSYTNGLDLISEKRVIVYIDT